MAPNTPLLQQALTDVQERKFVARRLEGVAEAAQTLYSRVGSKSPLVKRGLDALEKSTAWISAPLVSRLTSVGSPVITKLDSAMAQAYEAVDNLYLSKPADSQEQAEPEEGAEEVATADQAECKQLSRLHTLRLRAQRHREQLEALLAESVHAVRTKTIKQIATNVQSQLQKWEQAYLQPTRQAYRNAQQKFGSLNVPDAVTAQISAAHTRVSEFKQYVNAKMQAATDRVKSSTDTLASQVKNHKLYTMGSMQVCRGVEQASKVRTLVKSRLEATKSQFNECVQLTQEHATTFFHAATVRAQDDIKLLKSYVPASVGETVTQSASLAQHVWTNALQLPVNLSTLCHARLDPLVEVAKKASSPHITTVQNAFMAARQRAHSKRECLHANFSGLTQSLTSWTWSGVEAIQSQTLTSLLPFLLHTTTSAVHAGVTLDLNKLDESSRRVLEQSWKLLTFSTAKEQQQEQPEPEATNASTNAALESKEDNTVDQDEQEEKDTDDQKDQKAPDSEATSVLDKTIEQEEKVAPAPVTKIQEKETPVVAVVQSQPQPTSANTSAAPKPIKSQKRKRKRKHKSQAPTQY